MSRTMGAHRGRERLWTSATSVGERLWTKSGGRAMKNHLLDLAIASQHYWNGSDKFEISISVINLGRRRVRRWEPIVRDRSGVAHLSSALRRSSRARGARARTSK